MTIAADLALPDAAERGAAGLAGSPDILVNAAGVTLRHPFDSVAAMPSTCTSRCICARPSC